jgi:uncharacterized protein YecT (DUF1311 family)
MQRQSDIIEAIIQVRRRRKSDRSMSELFIRLMHLESAFSKRQDVHSELLRYFPVALVACLEGYFRLAIKELIDAGSPYLDRAAKVFGSSRLGTEVVKALHGKQISIGEFVAHNIPLGNLAHVNTSLSILLDKDFLTQLRSVADRWAHEIQGKPKTPILENPDSTYAAVARTFEIRHVICHEMASDFELKASEIEDGFAATTMFLKAADELIGDTLHPNAPLTQTAMNIAASADLDAALREVKSLCDAIRKTLEPERIEQFNRAVAAWVAFMEACATFEADAYKGGTIWPTIYGRAATALARSRAGELNDHLRRHERSKGEGV